jgi:Bacterial SH3 domain
MAQRAAGFAKKPVAAEPRRGEEANEQADAGPIALDLAPLVAPYRKHGRLALRVERLPPRARLSRGHNNGDRSWSLLSDELDGLSYLPPKGSDGTQTLGIRIVSLDGGDGATLALLDYVVSPGEAAVVTKMTPPRRAAEPLNENPELRRLREELAKATASLAERAEVKSEQPDFDAALEDRLAAAELQAEAKLETHRTAWQAEASANIAAADQRAQQRLAQSRESWRRESETALAEAEEAWKTGEAARLAAAEAGWQRRSEKALADALARAGAARGGDDARLRAANEALAETKILLGKRDAALAAAEARFAEAESAWTRRLDRAEALVLEGASRKSGEDAAVRRLRDELAETKALVAARDEAVAQAEARVAATEAEWKRRAEQAVAEALAREGASRKLAGDAAARKLRDELAQARALIAEREADLQRAQSDHEIEARQLRREADDALSHAQEAWKSDEAARAAAVKGEWQERSANALSEAASQLERARAETDAAALRGRTDAAELRRLKDDITGLKAIIAERNAALAEAQAAFERAREAWRADSAAAMADARRDWQSDEAHRQAAAEAAAVAAGEERIERVLADAAERLKKTEAQLAEARGQVDTLRHRGDPDDIRRLRHEFALLQGKLAEKDMELAHLRTDSELNRERWTSEARATLQNAERVWKAEAAEAVDAKLAGQTKRRFVRDIAFAAVLAVVAVLFFVRLGPATVDTVWPDIQPLVALIDPQVASQPAAVRPPPPVKVAAPALPLLSVERAANLRTGPSTSSTVIATLPRDDKVALLGRHGNWVQVRAGGTREGWIYNTYLKSQ